MCSCIYFVFFLFVFYDHCVNSQQIPFDTIVSFGDSNTDTSNVYNLTNHTWPIVPPYYQGRFSNGPVWIEKLGVTNLKNYAYGGATTDNNLVQGYTASDTKPVPGVRQQIHIYLNETKKSPINFERTLFVIWAGGNNYYFNASLYPATVAASILDCVKDLLRIGAKHILIVNQSPIQTMPFVKTEEQIRYYTQRTNCHNKNLSQGITKLDYDHKQVSLYLFDVYSFLLNIISNHSLNTKDSCWNISNGTITVLCTNPDLYVYIDQYHLTTRMHELIGHAAQKFIVSVSGVTKYSYSIFLILCALLFLA